MKERFIYSLKLSDGKDIALWLHYIPQNQQLAAKDGQLPPADKVSVVDWHIIPIGGKYQVIAHVVIAD